MTFIGTVLLIIAIILILAGIFFFTTATIGLLRFPDFYTRMHATGKGDTLGALLLLIGMALYTIHDGLTLANILVSLKIIFIAVFIFAVNPTACHAITRAGLDAGVDPWIKGEKRR